jgi:hypothetical protein
MAPVYQLILYPVSCGVVLGQSETLPKFLLELLSITDPS